ncbi:MAG TPA: glycosyltransferase [Flavisolibacter sp.]|nr:glycosyltransferase [Flavisolibacter sp.]
MQASKCIFILGATRFDAQYESTSFILAKQFAKNNNTVYYIEYPYTSIDAIRLRNTPEFEKRKKAIAGENNGIIDINIPNLNIVVIPPLLSIHFLPEGRLYRWLLNINENIIVKRLKKVIQSHKPENVIFINSFVFHYPNLAKKLQPKLSIYHCVDPVITPYDIKHGIVSEKLIIENSDLVICTSKKLYEEKKKMHAKTFFIPNAADINHSILATHSEVPIHPKLKSIKKPVIGYFGNIERRIDFEQMIGVAEKNKDKSFVFAGPVEKHLVPEHFFSVSNIYFTGRIPYSEMPAILKGFDVAIIPFKKNEDSNTVFPLKLFEYLGAGKSVVSTDFNLDLRNFTGDLVTYCSNAEEFSGAINKALATDSDQLKQARITLASEHTWEKRAIDFEKTIDDALSLKHFKETSIAKHAV